MLPSVYWRVSLYPYLLITYYTVSTSLRQWYVFTTIFLRRRSGGSTTLITCVVPWVAAEFAACWLFVSDCYSSSFCSCNCYCLCYYVRACFFGVIIVVMMLPLELVLLYVELGAALACWALDGFPEFVIELDLEAVGTWPPVIKVFSYGSLLPSGWSCYCCWL